MRYRPTWAAMMLLVAMSCSVPATAQTLWPEAGMRAVNALYAGTNPQDDAARRIAIVKVCEQMQFDLGDQWGNKVRTGLPVPEFLSPDSIAWRAGPNQPLDIWDVQASSGQILVFTGKPADHPNSPTGDATFVDCDPVDHIGGGTPPIDPPVDPPSGELEARVSALEATMAEVTNSLAAAWSSIEQLQAIVTNVIGRVTALESRPIPVACRASVFGIGIACSLVTQ